MAIPNDPSLARVQVATAQAGTYNDVGYVTSADLDRGSDGEATLKYLGGEVVVAGDRTISGTFNVIWDDEDTDGQDILEAAWEAGTDVWIHYCPLGTGTGEKAYEFSAKITSAPIGIDAEGEAVTGSFDFTGDVDDYSQITL